MNLSLTDLHCDTATELFRTGQYLTENDLAVSLKSASRFSPYTQVTAFFTSPSYSDEDGWDRFLATRKRLLCDPAIVGGTAKILTAFGRTSPPVSLLLSIEDARIFAGRIERVEEAYALGIRILTPLWSGMTCIGGSHDTTVGLTDFGRSVIRKALSLGMIPDISHASVRSADEIFEMAKEANRPVIASHSDASAICPVSRNLDDGQIRKILQSGGVIGLNLYVRFLSQKSRVTTEDVIPHVEHFLSLGASDALCLGCDMDGAELPADLHTVGDLQILADRLLARNYPETLVQKIFYRNANSFLRRCLPPETGSESITFPEEEIYP